MDNTHNHSHSHTHDISGVSGKKIFWVTVLNATITLTEIIGGFLSGSLSLLSDAIHNLSDTLSIALSYIANRIAKKPKNSKKTFGYKRAEIIAGFINSSILFLLSIAFLFSAYHRFVNPEIIHGTLMIIVGTIGLLANFISVFLLEGDAHDNLNIKASYLHLLSDTVSSVGVVLGGIMIQIWGIMWVDPVVTVLISLYILKETSKIILKTINILMQGSPDINIFDLTNDVVSFENVIDIHHIHTWMLNDQEVFFEAHLKMKNINLDIVNKTI